jgi:hypothetical protein
MRSPCRIDSTALLLIAVLSGPLTSACLDFMKRSVASGKPFYAYIPYTLVHLPTLPNPAFRILST